MITTKEGVEDCLAGAIAVAKHDGKEIGRAETDAFGDFKIERLDKGLGNVSLDIQYNGDTQSRDIQFNESLYIGCISF